MILEWICLKLTEVIDINSFINVPDLKHSISPRARLVTWPCADLRSEEERELRWFYTEQNDTSNVPMDSGLFALKNIIDFFSFLLRLETHFSELNRWDLKNHEQIYSSKAGGRSLTWSPSRLRLQREWACARFALCDVSVHWKSQTFRK